MRPFRRGSAPRPPPPPSPDGWAETRLEPASPADDWAASRAEPAVPNNEWSPTLIEPALPDDGWAQTRLEPASRDDGWPATRIDAEPAEDGWAETRVETSLPTRFQDDPDDYLATNPHDIGRLTGADVRELFVSCDPAEALQQQFAHLQPEFIAVHDLGVSASRQLLLGIARATGRRVQRLVIRRQGFGDSLATLEFVDVPTLPGRPLRVYSTDAVDTDGSARAAIARTLLGFSRLGVVVVGDMPPPAMAAALQPLREATASAAWRNRQLLLLPLAAPSVLAAQGAGLGQASGVAVRTTPQVKRPAEAWAFITASWSRLGDPVVGAGVRPAEPQAPTAAPAETGFRAMPVVDTPPERAADLTVERMEGYLRRLGEIAGMLSRCVFDVATGRPIAHDGAGPGAEPLALHGGQMLAAMGVAGRSLGFGRLTPDAAITFGAHHVLLRAVPNHPGLALHAVLDRHVANLALARMQLQRMDALFERPPG